MSNNRKSKASRKGGVAFLLPSLIGVIIFFVVPFLNIVQRSFMDNQAVSIVGLDNYDAVISNEAFQLAAENTFKFIAVCIPTLVVLSFLLAMLLKEKTPLKNLFKMGLLLPLAIPVSAAALLWSLLFDSSGLVNGAFSFFGIDALRWMNSDVAFWVLVACYLWRNLGYCVILWLAALSTIPLNIYEAARMDGASKLRSMLKITIPLLTPSFFVVFVIALINSFKVYREAYLVSGNYPHDSIYLLQHLFNNWFTSLSVGRMAAGGVLLFLVIFTFVLLLYKAWSLKEDIAK